MTDHRSLISAISSYVAATSTTLAGHRSMAAWALARPAFARYTSIAEVVRDCRHSGPQRQDLLLAELVSVPGDELAHLAALASLSRKLSAMVAKWRRGGASTTDLKDLEAALVSECWAEIMAVSEAWSGGRRCGEGLAVLIVEGARRSVRTWRRKESTRTVSAGLEGCNRHVGRQLRAQCSRALGRRSCQRSEVGKAKRDGGACSVPEPCPRLQRQRSGRSPWLQPRRLASHALACRTSIGGLRCSPLASSRRVAPAIT